MTITARPRDVTIASRPRDPDRAWIQEVAALLTELVRQPRRLHLRGRAPGDAQDYATIRNIWCGRARPIAMLLMHQLWDLHDGAPVEAVVRPLEAWIALLREYAGALPEPPAGVADLLAVIQRETRAQAALDGAEHALLAQPDSEAAADRLIAASEQYDREQEAMVRTVRERRARASVRRAVAGVT